MLFIRKKNRFVSALIFCVVVVFLITAICIISSCGNKEKSTKQTQTKISIGEIKNNKTDLITGTAVKPYEDKVISYSIQDFE